MAGPRHVWVDGRVLPADVPHLSVFDRGFQLGDGVFETLRARGGRATELAEHLARLRGSASGLGIVLPNDLDRLISTGLADLLAAEDLDGPDGDASVRITVSRGPFRGEHTASVLHELCGYPPERIAELHRDGVFGDLELASEVLG